jgi:hypothetical protein
MNFSMSHLQVLRSTMRALFTLARRRSTGLRSEAVSALGAFVAFIVTYAPRPVQSATALFVMNRSRSDFLKNNLRPSLTWESVLERIHLRRDEGEHLRAFEASRMFRRSRSSFRTLCILLAVKRVREESGYPRMFAPAICGLSCSTSSMKIGDDDSVPAKAHECQ